MAILLEHLYELFIELLVCGRFREVAVRNSIEKGVVGCCVLVGCRLSSSNVSIIS
jgi:hypothetical protein